ncbi:MAG: hypothetical protein P4L16_07660 [Chlamydiales bacterium]|nr:hypothetical protein [Chlamydiales bacterium]
MKRYLLAVMLLGMFTSCSMLSVVVDKTTRYEREEKDDPRYQQLIGKTFALNKDVYLYNISGSDCPTISASPSWEVVFEKDGSKTKYVSSPSCRLLEMVRRGNHLRVVKITMRGSYVKMYPERIDHIYVEFQSITGKKIVAEGEDLFAYPYSLLEPDLKYLTPVE